MEPDKLKPNDPRVESHTASINGKTYHYLLGNPPSGEPVATILLVHGWPDLSLGWRYQVPMLLSFNLRVIVPDMPGYGRTDAPEALGAYSLKSTADDLAALVAHVIGRGQQIILGGHDWGGTVVWRMALWHPELLRGVFSVCTPYVPPSSIWLEWDDYVKKLPNFRYQHQLAGPKVQAQIVGKPRLRQFLNGMYLAQGPRGEVVFTIEDGVLFQNLELVGPSPLVTLKELDYYVDEYNRHGMRGPLNWYRTRRINFEEEQPLVEAGRTRIATPALIVTATKDRALPPNLAVGMDKHFDHLEMREVNAHHYALWETAEDTNRHIAEFVQGLLRA